MTLLCFLLDLRSLSPQLLRELKQCLLQLANLYAISGNGERGSTDILQDRIGLCYIHRDRSSSSPCSDDELKIVYSPRGNFNLREFHHAVNNLPSDGFLPELCESGVTRSSTRDANLAKLLSNEALFSWGSKDILRKVILITSCLLQNTDTLRETLADAAEQCISVEFVVLEQEACQNDDTCENAKEFMNSISDLENCLLRSYYPE